MPVAGLGAAFFLAMLLICLPVAWRNPALGRVRLALAGVGVGFVIYLVYAELFLVGALCLWCTAVHVVAVALFGAVAFAAADAAPLTGAGLDGPSPGPGVDSIRA